MSDTDANRPTFLNQNEEFDYSKIGNNGLLLQNIYLPEEILIQIFSYIDPKELLNYSLVCQNWKRLIRSNRLWYMIYEREYKRKPKPLPWYLYYCLLSNNYFDTNLLMNENLVEKWKDGFSSLIRSSDFDPMETQDFNILDTKGFLLLIKARQTVRFRGWCGTGRRHYQLQWLIKLSKNKLLQYILDVYKPHISLTQLGSMYVLEHGFLSNEEGKCIVRNRSGREELGEQQFTKWLDIVITQYSEGIQGIVLEQVYNNQETRYADKGSVELLFDSIQPIEGTGSRKFSNFELITETHPVEGLIIVDDIHRYTEKTVLLKEPQLL